MKVNFLHYDLLSIPVNFRLSWGKLGFSRHVFVTLEVNGIYGFGEGVLYKTTHLEFQPFIKKLFTDWPKQNQFSSFASAREVVSRLVNFEPAIAFAFDTALWDIEGKTKKRSVNDLLGGKNRTHEITEEIFIEDNEATDRELAKILSHGTRSVKLKVGQNPKFDAEKILRIKKIAPSIKMKPDANRGYNFDDARRFVDYSGKENITLIEEPANATFSELASFRKQTGIKIMLDESVKTLDQLKSAINLNAIDVLNLKLTRIGGITNAKDFVAICEKNNISVSLGCNEETEVGMAAILHFAGYLKNLFGVEGLGPDRIKYHSSKKRFSIVDGFVSTPTGSGLLPDYTLDKSPLIYQNETGSSRFFREKEFLGIWKTRLENGLLKLWKN